MRYARRSTCIVIKQGQDQGKGIRSRKRRRRSNMIATEGYESDSKNLAYSSDEEKDDEDDLTCVDLGRYG